jgi:hypothetical protein
MKASSNPCLWNSAQGRILDTSQAAELLNLEFSHRELDRKPFF